jgi:cellulose synthase/poly-beta-1,6-N-acetylglucosamine synthase-like glycosyltransferase
VTTSTVSVIIGTYQRCNSIERCIRSLLAQTLAPLEIIVVDDGSTDRTPEVLTAMAREVPNLQVVLHPGNLGVAAALNEAVRHARGGYVAIADDDDVYLPRRLEASVALLESTGADMVGGQVVGSLRGPLRFATSRFPTDPAASAQRIAEGNDPLPHITMMVRRDAFERFGGYRPISRAADLELMLRWAHRGARIAVSPEVMADYTFRWEFFRVGTQTEWMLRTRYARAIAPLDDDEVLSFDDWFTGDEVMAARREAQRRIFRLVVRLGVGTLVRRS